MTFVCRKDDIPCGFPCPKRFNVALSESAYAQPRTLNARYGCGNNCLLTILLENLEEIADEQAMERVFQRFIAEYGAPDGE